MNNKLINIITSSDSLLARSFPLEHRTLKTRPALAFEVDKGGKIHGENNGKIQTNKKRKTIKKRMPQRWPENWISSRNRFFVVYVADIFSAFEIYSARITLSGIYYQNQGTNEIAELRGPLSVIPTFEGKSAIG